MQVLEKLVKNLDKKSEEFAHRVNLMKYAKEGRCPTDEFASEFQKLLEAELRMMEADEMIAKNRKQKSDHDELHALLGLKIEKEVEEEHDGKICKYFKEHGTCRYGDRCKFHHIDKSGKKVSKGKG